MSKLHFYTNFRGNPSWAADGDGDISKDENWSVDIEDGKVKQGHSYLVAQGKKPPVDWYPCVTGADKGGVATFAPKSPVELTGEQLVHGRAVTAFQASLLAVQKSVRIEIALEDLKDLKENGYRLCFAKKVAEGDYNVVWQSYDKFVATNTFSWTPMYQLFGSNTFKDNIEVDVSSNVVDIGIGETSLLDDNGILNQPKTKGKPTAITLDNQYGSIHPGLNQVSTGINGKLICTPIYVAPKAMVSGVAELTPVESVLVWFEQNIVTSTIFSTARSRAIEINLTTVNSATRKYQAQKWVTP